MTSTQKIILFLNDRSIDHYCGGVCVYVCVWDEEEVVTKLILFVDVKNFT